MHIDESRAAEPTSAGGLFACRALGHRYRFTAQGATMHWNCQRGCGAGDSKTYPSAQVARRYATTFNREDRDDLGRRAPLLGMFPLRVWRAIRRRYGAR